MLVVLTHLVSCLDLDFHPFLEGETPLILGVGKLEAQKDFPVLIRAFAQVRKRRDVKLMILGWGRERDNLEKLIRDLALEKDVYMPGYIPNPYPYIKRAGVVVLSSAWEGLPTVLIEAMATGTPVIASAKGGPLDIVQDEKTGLFFKPNDANDLADKILFFEKNRDMINRLGMNARKRAEEKHNIESIIDKTEAAYRMIIKEMKEE